MSRTCIPFSTGDLSAFARSLREQLAHADGLPGHVELLNMLARSAGFRNYQSLRASAAARGQLETAQPAPEPVDFARVQRMARHFDEQGRLATWPASPNLRSACLWVLWSRIPAGESLTEDRLNRTIRANHTFGDHALLRRELCEQDLVKRTADGREYRRVERAPSPEGLALIRYVAARHHDGRQR